jgi:tetratricopeptide (TPR) repeat protein
MYNFHDLMKKPSESQPSADPDLPADSFEERIDILFEELSLAIHWDRPSILIAVYESEYLREEVFKILESRLSKLNQTVTNFHIDEKQFDVPMILVQNPDHENTVFFITGLKWGGGKGGFNAYRALNMRREFFVDNQMRVVLWLTKKEATNLPRHAPDFWAFRHRVVEFYEVRSARQDASISLPITWDGWKSSELAEGVEEKIRLRESMLSELPDGKESVAARTDLIYTLASYYWASGDLNRASTLLEKGSQLAGEMKDSIAESQFWAGKGIVLHSRLDLKGAISAYQKAIHLNSYNTFARTNLAIAYFDSDETEKAIEVGRKIIEIKPKESTGYAILGDIYRQAGHFEEAKDCYQNASRLEPKAAINWMNLGGIFVDQKRSKEALRAYLKASRLTPDDPEVWKKIGDVYAEMGRANEAKKSYQKAESLVPAGEGTQGSLP